MNLVLFVSILAAVQPAPQPVAVRYEPIAELKNYSPTSFEPWSPKGLLALTGRDGLSVFDPRQPTQSPRRIALAGYDARWSPEGDWILFQSGRGATSRLIAVQVADAWADTIYTGEDLWPYVWASDGRIYGWLRTRSHPRVSIGPPRRWLEEHKSEKRVPHAILLPMGIGFMPGAAPSDWILPIYDPRTASVLLRNTFPGDSLYLAMVTGKGASVIDTRGNLVRTIPMDSVSDWWSVSADGQLLLGDREILTPDGENLADAVLFVGDATGSWATRIEGAPSGITPFWSRQGDLFCAKDPVTDVVHVGRVVCTLPRLKR